MKVRDIVTFNKESFFNGAVQTEWFYDEKRIKTIAESYVFHGPKYYGVSQTDVNPGEHRLIDTASFAKNLTDKLYSDKPSNSFVMTIAGYGTGKSHLAVCLGGLFSGDAGIRSAVTANISKADRVIGEYICQHNTKDNLVIVLNGMNNFNLDAEILRCSRLALAQRGISDNLLKKVTKSYDMAKHFVSHTFSYNQDRFNQSAEEAGVRQRDSALKAFLLENTETDPKVLAVINRVYEEVNGDRIAWDRGLSARDVLLELQAELCGPGKPFNKILLLFDEFGRYIEYTASNPIIAGDAALQQIFEAIQTADGGIIFVGFIQNELKQYLARINQVSTITRYIDRYSTASENLYLSTNFETILANLLKKQETSFDKTVGSAITRYENFHSHIFGALGRWDQSANKKSVWTERDLYNTVILRGCYPLHPITTWLLSGTHQWMQQRSTLSFVAEMYDLIADKTIEGAWLPYIYPVQVIDSGIFSEMLNAEEKGLVASQYCILYRNILSKVGEKLTVSERTVLKAILVMNMGRMKFHGKEDAVTAIRYCSNLKEEEIPPALKSLEEMHGVIAYDEKSNTFDLVADANGFYEFQRIFSRYRIGVKASVDDIDNTLYGKLGIDKPVETPFGAQNHISSTEWKFDKRLVDTTSIDEMYIKSVINIAERSSNGDDARGALIYAYCHENPVGESRRISELCKDLNLEKHAVIILFLNDEDRELTNALIVKKTLQKFSLADRERFSNLITKQTATQDRKVESTFNKLVAKREMISVFGVSTYDGRISGLCLDCFNRLFSKPVPFQFDGFENKQKSQAKSALTNICVSLLNHKLLNVQEYASLTPKDKNRVAAVLSIRGQYSWKVYNDQCQLITPGNPLIQEIHDELIADLESGEQYSGYSLFYKYISAPYGMNENSLALLISCFIAERGSKYLYLIGSERLSSKHWADNRGKVKIPEFRKMTFRKNPNFNADPIGDLCKKILANREIEKCEQLKDQLQELVNVEGETEKNKYQIAQARSYLEEGMRLYKTCYDKLNKVKKTIEESYKTFAITKVVSALEAVPKVTTGRIDASLNYEFSLKYEEEVHEVQQKLDALLRRYYLKALSKVTCKITELSQRKSTYDRIARILRNNGYEDLADATVAHIKGLESEVLAKQRYESALVDCEKDLALGSAITKYQECCEHQEKLRKWINFFTETEDLPARVSLPLLKKLTKAIQEAEKKKESIIEQYHRATMLVANAKTPVDLRQADAKLEKLSEKQLESEVIENIIDIRENIAEAIDAIGQLPDTIDSIAQYIENIDEKTNRYCWRAIKASAEAAMNKLQAKQRKWVVKYIEPAEQSYREMNPQGCAVWLEKTKVLPEYLTAETIMRYNDTKKLVESRMHQSRVEELVAKYELLTEAEKDEFRKALGIHAEANAVD